MSDLPNAYEAPRSDVVPAADEPDATELWPASGGRRFANLLIDTVAYYLFAFLLGIVFALVGASAVVVEGGTLFGFGVMLTYYIGCEALFGRTVGKLVTGTKVVDEHGNPPSLGKVIGRSFARFVPFEAFSFLGPGASGWHDKWSGTRVVHVRSPMSVE